MVNVSIALYFLLFVTLAGKWRHKMDLKFSIFIFVHLFCSDQRRPLTLNQKNYQNILFRSRDTIVTMSKFVTKKKNLCKFHCIISPD